VLGKLLFKSNCLQLLVTDVKKGIIYFIFLQNLKSNMLQSQLGLLFKSTEMCYIHIAAECDINSNNDKIVEKSN